MVQIEYDMLGVCLRLAWSSLEQLWFILGGDPKEFRNSKMRFHNHPHMPKQEVRSSVQQLLLRTTRAAYLLLLLLLLLYVKMALLCGVRRRLYAYGT